MNALISFLAIVFGVAVYIEKYFVSDEVRQSVKQNLTKWHQRANTPDVVELLQNNFLLLSLGLDKIFGNQIFSRRLLNITALFTWGFLGFSLAYPQIAPKSSLGMRPTPPEVIEFLAAFAPKLADQMDKDQTFKKTTTLTPAQLSETKEILSGFSKLNTPTIRIEFTFLCMIAFWILGTLITLLSLVLGRLLIRELVHAQSIVIMITCLISNLIAIIIAYSIGIILICSVLFIPFGLLIWAALILAMHFSFYLFLWLLGTFAILGCAFAPVWIKALMLYSLLPTFLIVLCLAVALVPKPARATVYGTVNSAALWIIEQRHGPLAFIFSTIGLILGGISYAASLFKVF